MDWKKIAVEDLRNYNYLEQAIVSLPLQISALEEEFLATKGTLGQPEPVSGGQQKKAEERLLSNICRRQRLEHNLQAVKRLLANINDGLAVLTEAEKLVLECFFINRTEDYLERLHVALDYELAQIYRIKDAALRKFTMAMYGVLEL